MKYRVSMTILNRETLEQRFVDKDFESVGLQARFDAQDFAEEIESTLEEDEAISYRKVKPVVQCVCGEEIFCTEFTNTCDCGRYYNFNGTLLAPGRRIFKMLIRTITDKENGRKWEIYQNGDRYSYKYYEFFNKIGWRLTGSEENFTKDAIEFEFDIIL